MPCRHERPDVITERWIGVGFRIPFAGVGACCAYAPTLLDGEDLTGLLFPGPGMIHDRLREFSGKGAISGRACGVSRPVAPMSPYRGVGCCPQRFPRTLRRQDS